ncbi:hypothetical protein HMPREF2137_10190 [Hoylesella buccalis DNF00853]|uniref:Uncharacterized protein n=1 Tax=Hoylesella buccalis DNF00853 TaxID=1401074 RepID=A0A095ZGK0_9BACT|nr:hypothetical protein HMPREF2137_10190 [Hoylesella buccalis DNF00853]KGF41925.1 hypothetical protein HMPREF2140_02225 [Hoylesella buccalis DNF00985]
MILCVFNCIDFEWQSHVNWMPMSITLGANVIHIGFQDGCARTPVDGLPKLHVCKVGKVLYV